MCEHHSVFLNACNHCNERLSEFVGTHLSPTWHKAVFCLPAHQRVAISSFVHEIANVPHANLTLALQNKCGIINGISLQTPPDQKLQKLIELHNMSTLQDVVETVPASSSAAKSTTSTDPLQTITEEEI